MIWMQLQIDFDPMCKPYVVSHAYDLGQKSHKFDEKLSNLVQCVVIYDGVKLLLKSQYGQSQSE